MFEISQEKFREKGQKLVFRHDSKQILLIGMGEKIFALDNRCPHEGYPLSEGTGDPKSCLLTCNWHNWKFDLNSGKCVMGADNVTTYPVAVKGETITVDVSEPKPEQVQNAIMEGFAEGFKKSQKGRMTRELARLHFNGFDPLVAVVKSIVWSHDKFEYGMTHAYAALADWLALFFEVEGDSDKALEEKMVCLSEGVSYVAHDSTRRQSYPFGDKDVIYSAEALTKAVESEDASLAESLVATGLASGMTFSDFEQVFTEIALEHYNDFGHSLIYVYKTSQVSKMLDSPEVDKALALSLVRSLAYTTREDLIPEFKAYAPALEKMTAFGKGEQVDTEGVREQRVNGACSWLVEQAPRYSAEALYRSLLKLNADNFLRFDLKHQEAVYIPVSKNVGWLSFTHGITFANSVRAMCTKYPHLWSRGLLQMACFYGRNTAYLDKNVSFDDWKVESPEKFFTEIKSLLYDHSMPQPIVSAHLIKTAFATREEYEKTGEEYLLAAFNRFINSPLKRTQIRRGVYQAINLVKKDFL